MAASRVYTVVLVATITNVSEASGEGVYSFEFGSSRVDEFEFPEVHFRLGVGLTLRVEQPIRLRELTDLVTNFEVSPSGFTASAVEIIEVDTTGRMTTERTIDAQPDGLGGWK